MFVIDSGGTKGWHVFYHFVGAVPGSTELDKLLRRFLTDMQTLSKVIIILHVLIFGNIRYSRYQFDEI